jgi:hypothetical protein
MRIFLTFCYLLLAYFGQGQSIELHAIGSSGNFSSSSSGATLSSTIGEIAITTESSSSAILTQGFQQSIITITPVTKINENTFGIQIFPTPTSQLITVKKEQQDILFAELIDVQGKVLSKYKLTEETTEIDLKDLPSSTYFLTVKATDKQAVQTFKIQKIQ